MNVYRRSGACENIVWRVYERAIDWFVLEEGQYVAQAPDAEGILHNRCFPGLRLPVQAILAGKLAEVLAALQQGAQTAEQAVFIETLRHYEHNPLHQRRKG